MGISRCSRRLWAAPSTDCAQDEAFPQITPRTRSRRSTDDQSAITVVQAKHNGPPVAATPRNTSYNRRPNSVVPVPTASASVPLQARYASIHLCATLPDFISHRHMHPPRHRHHSDESGHDSDQQRERSGYRAGTGGICPQAARHLDKRVRPRMRRTNGTACVLPAQPYASEPCHTAPDPAP